MNIRVLINFVSIAFWSHANAQETWRMAYGAFGPEEGNSVQVADDGNFVVAGSTGSFGSGTSDIYLLKLDGAGTVLWSKTIGGPMIEQTNDLVRMNDGGWLIVGTTNDAGSSGGYDGMLVRTDADGLVLWQKDYGGSDWDFFHKGVLQSDGGFLMIGQTFSQGAAGDAWLVKTDQNGDTLWTRHFGGSGLDDGEGVVETLDGGIALAGSLTNSNGDLDAYVIKMDDQLNVQWDYTYGGDSLDQARDIVTTQDGGFSIVGTTRSFSNWTEHYHFKVNSNGILQWQKNWGQVNDQEAYRHIELPSGGFATTGWTKTSGGGGKDMFLFLCDSQGEFIAQHTFGGAEDDEGYSVAKTTDGFIVCGATLSYGAGSDDVFVVRTDSSGNTASEVVTDYLDPLTIRSSTSPATPLFYPNPSSGTVEVTAHAIWKEIDLLDVQGRVLNAWPKGTAHLDLSDFTNGAYFIRAIDRNGNSTVAPLILNKP